MYFAGNYLVLQQSLGSVTFSRRDTCHGRLDLFVVMFRRLFQLLFALSGLLKMPHVLCASPRFDQVVEAKLDDATDEQRTELRSYAQMSRDFSATCCYVVEFAAATGSLAPHRNDSRSCRRCCSDPATSLAAWHRVGLGSNEDLCWRS